jgi:hypothetical protein
MPPRPSLRGAAATKQSNLLAALLDYFAGACHRAGHFGPDPLAHPGYKRVAPITTPRQIPRKSVNFYQIFTNKPEDWHFWRSARSEDGGAVRNALNRMEARREIAALLAEVQPRRSRRNAVPKESEG